MSKLQALKNYFSKIKTEHQSFTYLKNKTYFKLQFLILQKFKLGGPNLLLGRTSYSANLLLGAYCSGSGGGSGAPAGLAGGASDRPSAPLARPALAPLSPLLPLLWYFVHVVCLI